MRRNRQLPTRNGAPSRQQSAILKKMKELAAYCRAANALVILDPYGEAIPIGQICPNRRIIAAFHYPPRPDDDDDDDDPTMRDLTKKYHDVLKQLDAERKKLADLEEQKKQSIQRYGAWPSWIDKPAEEMTQEELDTAMPKLDEMLNHLKKKLRELDEKEAAQIPPAAEEAGTSTRATVGGGAPSDPAGP